MNNLRRTLRAIGLGAALVAAAAPTWAQSGNEWTTYGGDAANTRYTSLEQKTPQNVGKLRGAWIPPLGSLESQESTPLFMGETIYVTTSTGPKYVFALNAKAGSTKGKDEPELPPDYAATVCCGLDNRGV